MLEAIIRALPLGDERERALFAKFAEVSRATIKGTLVIGIVQGFLGGIMFSILGVTGAVFWGVVMVILSILPIVGASIVWVPVAIVLLINGAWIKALVLAIFGAVVIGLIDNILRPQLVGRDTKMPDYIILLSTLGGLAVFGISGFVIGPVIASLFLAVWVMFEEEHMA
jgi:predicted PurR-regulated permease PerM